MRVNLLLSLKFKNCTTGQSARTVALDLLVPPTRHLWQKITELSNPDLCKRNITDNCLSITLKHRL